MRIGPKTLLLIVLLAFSATWVEANSIAWGEYGTLYGPAYEAASLKLLWLIVPTILIEYGFLILVLRPTRPFWLGAVVVCVHCISYPITLLIGDYLLWLAEIAAVVIEYYLYRWIHNRSTAQGGMGRRWIPGWRGFADVFIANLLSFWGGAIIYYTFMYTPMSITPPTVRVGLDMRSLATALECYFVDCNKYPDTLDSLTTPIAYISRIPSDPMHPSFADGMGPQFRYFHKGTDWILWSVGPNRRYDIRKVSLLPFFDLSTTQTRARTESILRARYTYDPTNGTRSGGDIWRIRS